MIFNTKKSLGVDIGSSGVRIAEITKHDNHAQLTNYGHVTLPRSIDTDLSDPKDCQLVQDAINTISRQAKFSTNKAYSAIPGHCLSSQVFKFDHQATKPDIEDGIKKDLPLKHLDKDVIIEWQDIEPKNTNQYKIVQANATTNNYIDNHDQVFAGTMLDLEDLETTHQALAASLVGQDKRPVLLVDIGEYNSDIAVIENGLPILTHSVKFGGHQITEAIARHLKVGKKEAEQFKKDHPDLIRDSNKDSIAQKNQNILIAKIKSTLKRAATTGIKVDKIIVSGGGSSNEGFVSWLGKKLAIKSYQGNTWSRVKHESCLTPLLRETSCFYPIAVGAAMKGLQ